MMPDAPERILRINTVLDRTGLSRAMLYRKINDGTFPKQIKLSTRCAGWYESTMLPRSGKFHSSFHHRRFGMGAGRK